ncbi:hypothetical protein BCL57_002808 [Agromyces flavus]|uniref:HEAT repeat-containing protein n=1 Tax=Agromyces flavus TaxID=589382 RepID=A0A1H1LVG5_9MICO|nr:HEAT repeat domain-containing protein [Agromyces flavus]MCP2368632.1 hypothetical protein [Agromyces flavus]GGI48128.1 hypothetical protein GCM10010932_28160 [Agromyces flavus]SDR78015.1 hypothetical protein SAMN04489721_0261 [Agromyces flavus]
MAVTMKQVRAALDPEEPDYTEVVQLGPGALKHLQALIASDEPMIASKAAYAAGLFTGDEAREVVRSAAASDDPIVRVAAAASAANLPEEDASVVLAELVADPDEGVRKVARTAVPVNPSEELVARLEEVGTESANEGPEGAPEAPPTGGLMPGERPDTGAAGMPGERGGLMPGESGGMPGR